MRLELILVQLGVHGFGGSDVRLASWSIGFAASGVLKSDYAWRRRSRVLWGYRFGSAFPLRFVARIAVAVPGASC